MSVICIQLKCMLWQKEQECNMHINFVIGEAVHFVHSNSVGHESGRVESGAHRVDECALNHSDSGISVAIPDVFRGGAFYSIRDTAYLGRID